MDEVHSFNPPDPVAGDSMRIIDSLPHMYSPHVPSESKCNIGPSAITPGLYRTCCCCAQYWSDSTYSHNHPKPENKASNGHYTLSICSLILN